MAVEPSHRYLNLADRTKYTFMVNSNPLGLFRSFRVISFMSPVHNVDIPCVCQFYPDNALVVSGEYTAFSSTKYSIVSYTKYLEDGIHLLFHNTVSIYDDLI